MARLGSAYPGDDAGQASATGLGMGRRYSALKENFTSERGLQVAAGLHLTAIAAAVVSPSHPPLPFFLTVTGLALVVVALLRAQPAENVVAASVDAQAARAMELETQSQRLVEIADAASRARREAEMRSQLWAELTARMSHELRTPLNVVVGFTDIMNSEMFGPLGHERYRDYTRHIRECSRTLLKCTEDTLALTSSLAKSTGSESNAILSIEDMLNEATEYHASELTARNVSLEWPSRADRNILGDARSTRQIIINLVAEAIDRTRRGGIIRVEFSDDAETIAMTLKVENTIPRADVGQASLPICIARVLLEQQGSGLIEKDDHETWQITTFFDCPAQADFFSH